MSDPERKDQPNPFAELQRALAGMQKGLRQAGDILTAQGAMGWAYRGDLDRLRAALDGMSTEQLQQVSAAAALLASMADEVLSGRRP